MPPRLSAAIGTTTHFQQQDQATMSDEIDLIAVLKADHCSIDTINGTLAGVTPAGNPRMTRAFVGSLGANGGQQQ
jgi:hypothetical protein